MGRCTTANLALPIRPDELALLRAVRDALASQIGRCSYVAAVLYGLRLAAQHLRIQPAPVTLPLTPLPIAADEADADRAADRAAAAVGPPQRKPRRKRT